MKKLEKPRASSSTQTRRPASNSRRKDQTPCKVNVLKPLNSKALDATSERSNSLNDSTSETSEVYENMNVHYMDDTRNYDDDFRYTLPKTKSVQNLEDCNESDTGTNRDSVSSSSQGDFFATEYNRGNRPSLVSKSKSSLDRHRASKERSDAESLSLRSSTFHGVSPRKSSKPGKGQAKIITSFTSRKSSEYEKAYARSLLRPPEAIHYKPFEEAKEDDIWEDAVNDVHVAGSDTENKKSDVEEVLTQKIGTLEARVEELEEELREVAALEMSLYSVFPEHGSSPEKLHKPARHLSRLYVIARKSQVDSKLITVSKNIVSGLFTVSKSCGTDVPRLIFWLSNMVVLREIISQAYGGTKANKTTNLLEEDWNDVGTFLAALRQIESSVFTRVVESLWSQVMMFLVKPHESDASVSKTVGKHLRSAQSSIHVTLWENVFEEALQRLCPIRAARGKCSCSTVLTKMAMEQFIARLDVAMFNAILRESAHRIATDPISDPIGDSRVLPIPAGVLSFESGVKLKNAVGYWSRFLMDIYETEADDSPDAEQHDNDTAREEHTFKPLKLLNELSDILMLPKHMLINRSTRREVCPSIDLRLIKRILCNFSPDDFCPDLVPVTVLEELHAQSIREGRSSGNLTSGFPRQVAPVLYTPPSCRNLTKMAADFTKKLRSSVTRKNGYTSDEEVEMKSPRGRSFFPWSNNRFKLLNKAQLR